MVPWYFSYLTGHPSVSFAGDSLFFQAWNFGVTQSQVTLWIHSLCDLNQSHGFWHHLSLMTSKFQIPNSSPGLSPGLQIYISNCLFTSPFLCPKMFMSNSLLKINYKSTFWFLSQSFCFFSLVSANGISILLVAQTKKLAIILIIHPIYEKCTLRNMSRT